MGWLALEGGGGDEGGGGKTRGRRTQRGRKERRSLSSLRVLFLLPLSSSALMFSLLRLSYPPFDFSCTVGIVLCRHLDLQSCRLNNRRSETRGHCIYWENRKLHECIIIHCLNLSGAKFKLCVTKDPHIPNYYITNTKLINPPVLVLRDIQYRWLAEIVFQILYSNGNKVILAFFN